MSVVLMGLVGTAFQFYAVDMNVAQHGYPADAVGGFCHADD